ncbi:MAG: Chemotaxis protein CheW [Desulfovibrio sp.]
MTLENNGHKDDIIQFGTFSLDSQQFGVNILRMREIIRPLEITRVPRAERFMEGVINLRGVVIPIISLRARFGMPIKPFDKETRIINMEIDGMVVGFIVDAIGHVRRFPAGAVEEPPAVTVTGGTEYIAGVAREDDTIFVILDVDQLVSVEELRGFTQE